MGEIITKIVFFIFIVPLLIFQEGYPKFVAFIEKKGWGSPALFFALFLLILIFIVLWGMGAR